MERMTKIKIGIIILIISISILILTISILNREENSEKDNSNDVNTIKYENPLGTTKEEPIELSNISFKEYFNVKNCVSSYISTLNLKSSIYYGYNENNEYVDVVEESVKRKNIYNLLSKDYISTKGITEENVLQYIQTIEENKLIAPVEILKKENPESKVSEYYIKSLIISITDRSKYISQEFIVYIDYENNSFSIVPENIQIENTQNKIDKNDNNGIANIPIKEATIVREYGTNFKNLILSDANEAYNLLNEEYKNRRFPTIESFKEYIDRNRSMLEQMNIEKYELKRIGGVYQYYCLDQHENVYVFNDKGTFDYNIILDYYTVDIPQFVEQYEQAQETEKVGYNVNKCIDSINNFDYTYMYSKLDENFKKNNFQNEESFKEFIKNNLFEKNEAINISCTQEGEVYVCDVNIANANDRSQAKKVTFIMKLGSGIDFVMSFSME